MTDKNEKPVGMERYAAHWVLVLSGSLMVLSVTLNNIGLGKVIDAWTQSWVIENQNAIRGVQPQQCIYPTGLMNRIEELEELAHQSGTKH